MDRIQLKSHRRRRRKRGIRKRMLGTAARPRLTVFRSARHIYAQVIDDLTGRTLVAASTNEKGAGFDYGGNCDAAKKVGSAIAERAKAGGVDKVIFDRNGYVYHGRVRSLAEGAREGGLKF
jgi:large subunit ribosomal protein L18